MLLLLLVVCWVWLLLLVFTYITTVQVEQLTIALDGCLPPLVGLAVGLEEDTNKGLGQVVGLLLACLDG